MLKFFIGHWIKIVSLQRLKQPALVNICSKATATRYSFRYSNCTALSILIGCFFIPYVERQIYIMHWLKIEKWVISCVIVKIVYWYENCHENLIISRAHLWLCHSCYANTFKLSMTIEHCIIWLVRYRHSTFEATIWTHVSREKISSWRRGW